MALVFCNSINFSAPNSTLFLHQCIVHPAQLIAWTNHSEFWKKNETVALQYGWGTVLLESTPFFNNLGL